MCICLLGIWSKAWKFTTDVKNSLLSATTPRPFYRPSDRFLLLPTWRLFSPHCSNFRHLMCKSVLIKLRTTTVAKATARRKNASPDTRRTKPWAEVRVDPIPNLALRFEYNPNPNGFRGNPNPAQFLKRTPLYHISGPVDRSWQRKDIYFESQTVQASECKRSRDYKEATASAEALLARQLNARPAR